MEIARISVEDLCVDLERLVDSPLGEDFGRFVFELSDFVRFHDFPFFARRPPHARSVGVCFAASLLF